MESSISKIVFVTVILLINNCNGHEVNLDTLLNHVTPIGDGKLLPETEQGIKQYCEAINPTHFAKDCNMAINFASDFKLKFKEVIVSTVKKEVLKRMSIICRNMDGIELAKNYNKQVNPAHILHQQCLGHVAHIVSTGQDGDLAKLAQVICATKLYMDKIIELHHQDDDTQWMVRRQFQVVYDLLNGMSKVNGIDAVTKHCDVYQGVVDDFSKIFRPNQIYPVSTLFMALNKFSQ